MLIKRSVIPSEPLSKLQTQHQASGSKQLRAGTSQAITEKQNLWSFRKKKNPKPIHKPGPQGTPPVPQASRAPSSAGTARPATGAGPNRCLTFTAAPAGPRPPPPGPRPPSGPAPALFTARAAISGRAEQHGSAGRSGEPPPPPQAPPQRAQAPLRRTAKLQNRRTTTPIVLHRGPGRRRRRCCARAARGALGAVVPPAALQPGTAVPAAAAVWAAPPGPPAIPRREGHGRQPAQARAFAGSERYRRRCPTGSRPPGRDPVGKQRV